jgi:hypothetical protein
MSGHVPFEDRAAIQELMARYAWTLDVDDPDGTVALFTPDGVFDGTSGTYEGHARIREMAASSRRREAPHLVQHWVANSLFDGDGERCTVRSMCIGPSTGGGAPALAFVGYYLDRCVKVGGAWRFAYRRWRPWSGEMPA